MKNKNRVITAVAVAAFIGIMVFGIVKTANDRRRAEEAAAEAARIAALVQERSEEAIMPIAQAYGLDDLVFDYAEEIDGSHYTNVYMTSESFADLSDEEKLGFLVAIDELTHLNDDIFGSGTGTHANNYMEFTLICNENEYDTFTTDGESRLRENESTIFSMDTDFARGVHNRLYGSDSNKSSGSKSCKKCGASGVNLTAGGYCKTCVDTYYTDYYVDWDGQISADRPY